MPDAGCVFVIDEDEGVRRALSWRLGGAGHSVETFATGDDFLRSYDPSRLGCVVSELRLRGLSGIAFVEELAARAVSIPVIILTEYGDTQSAVRALKSGAFDFVEKPIDEGFFPRVAEAIGAHRQCEERRRQYASVRVRFGALTERERQVMRAVISGKANKVIAFDLGLSEKTIEAHRARVMQKLQVGSLAELVRIDALAQLTESARTNGDRAPGRLAVVRRNGAAPSHAATTA
ncbi:MAG TPA: response regulator [Candidatus Binatia bacterium]|nr:response regulator [Candidatus Binatia bacterium]